MAQTPLPGGNHSRRASGCSYTADTPSDRFPHRESLMALGARQLAALEGQTQDGDVSVQAGPHCLVSFSWCHACVALASLLGAALAGSQGTFETLPFLGQPSCLDCFRLAKEHHGAPMRHLEPPLIGLVGRYPFSCHLSEPARSHKPRFDSEDYAFDQREDNPTVPPLHDAIRKSLLVGMPGSERGASSRGTQFASITFQACRCARIQSVCARAHAAQGKRENKVRGLIVTRPNPAQNPRDWDRLELTSEVNNPCENRKLRYLGYVKTTLLGDSCLITKG